MSHPTNLPNKPLIEAIFELKWVIETKGGVSVDPNYNFLIGQLYNQIKAEYPHKEILQTAHLPLEIVKHVPQYRFRPGLDKWPLVQLGHGLMAFNETTAYSWEGNFRKNCEHIAAKFFGAYPDIAVLRIQELQLKYINAFVLPSGNVDIFQYLGENLKTQITLPKQVAENSNMDFGKSLVNLTVNTPVSNLGMIRHKISTGKKADQPAVIMEISVSSNVTSSAEDCKNSFSQWLSRAHDMIENSFFSFPSDNLMETFKNG